jgi:hypothetical protein
MKKVLLIMILFSSVVSKAQEIKPLPQISVSGEGKIKQFQIRFLFQLQWKPREQMQQM